MCTVSDWELHLTTKYWIFGRGLGFRIWHLKCEVEKWVSDYLIFKCVLFYCMNTVWSRQETCKCGVLNIRFWNKGMPIILMASTMFCCWLQEAQFEAEKWHWKYQVYFLSWWKNGFHIIWWYPNCRVFVARSAESSGIGLWKSRIIEWLAHDLTFY